MTNSMVDEELRTLLAAALKASGCRQGQAAQQIGVSQSAISKMLHGHSVALKTATATRNWARDVLGANLEETVKEVPDGIPASADPREKLPEASQTIIGSGPPARQRVTTCAKTERHPSSVSLSAMPQALEDHAVRRGKPSQKSANPYEVVLRTLLESVAQRHLEEIAGPAAQGVTVRVSLEWGEGPNAKPKQEDLANSEGVS